MTQAPSRGEQIIRRADIPADQYLYHYTTAATLALILESGCLRMGPFSNTNDPRENKAWHAGMGGPAGGFWEDDYYRDVRDIDYQLRGRVKLACLTRDRPWSSNMDYHYYHRGWARARMWQQYADAHCGACLMFDRAQLGLAIEQHVSERGDVQHGNVLYEDEPIRLNFSGPELARLGVEAAVRSYRRQYWQELFLRKNTDWESEVEYRYLAFTDNPFEDVSIHSALLAVVLGEVFPPEELALLPERLEAAGTAQRVRVGACAWWQGEPLVGVPKGWDRGRDL